MKNWTPNKFNFWPSFVILFQFTSFLVGLSLVIFVGVSAYWFLCSIVFYFLIDSLGVQITLHKYLSHKAFEFKNKLVKNIFLFFSIFSGQGAPHTWSSIHKFYHHPYAETNDDPHTPLKGHFYSFMGWYWKYVGKTHKLDRGALKDKFVLNLYRYFIIYFLGTCAVLFLIHPYLVIFGIGIGGFLSNISEGCVNSFLHLPGKYSKVFFMTYKIFPEQVAYNSLWLGPLTMGLGYHNTHHERPYLKNYALKWYEFDPSYLIIKVIEK